MLGAKVAAHALARNSAQRDAFDVRIIHTDDYPFLRARDGQQFLRDGVKRHWRMDDLQSFTPLRFLPPELMGYQGRAVVIDPDIFADRGHPGAARAGICKVRRSCAGCAPG